MSSTDMEPGWANESVIGRFPSGTDPHLAVQAVYDAGMERTDGTNARDWWERLTWWHGSHDGIRSRTDLLPPSLTGIVPHLDSTDPNSVYVTRIRADAIMYACWHQSPMLYEVTFHVEPQIDDFLDDENSFRVPKARVRRSHGITREEAQMALNQVFGVIE